MIFTTKHEVVVGLRLLFVVYLLTAVGPIHAQNEGKLTVRIQGLEEELRENVEAYLSIKQLTDEPLTNEARMRWLHDKAEQEIRRALEPFGYYRPQIEADLNQTAEGWEAVYRVQPGPPIRITQVDVQVLDDGAEDPAFQRILDTLPLNKGDILRHPRYQEIKQAFQNVATERGYFDARFEISEIRVDLEDYETRIVLHYATGKRYRFGEITFHQDVLSPEFLHRYLTFEQGDPYRVSPLLNLQSALIDSEHFSRVEVSAAPDKAKDHIIPVDIHLEPRKRLKFTVGAGFGTDTGLRGRVGFEQRRVNRWGHSYRLNALASQIKLGLAGEYIIPGKNPRTDQYVVHSSYIEENSESIDSETAIIGVSRQRQDGLWLKNLSLDFQRETFSFDSDERTSILLMPSLVWTRVDVENRLNITRGNRISLELRGAYEGLLSDVSFIQAAVRGNWIQPLGENGRLLLRGSLGSSLVSDFDELPATVRFFAGGDRSVRGFELDEIGPRNEEGDVIGGKHLMVGSVEYEYLIKENWGIAAFVDSGTAFDETPDFKTGVGVGVRWHSPVGPVRVDLASGLEEPGEIIRLHVTIGPEL